MKNLHISIQNNLHDELRNLAEIKNISKTEIIRLALNEYLKQAEQDRIKTEMRQYAERMAKYSSEFTEEFDSIVTEKLLAETEW